MDKIIKEDWTIYIKNVQFKHLLLSVTRRDLQQLERALIIQIGEYIYNERRRDYAYAVWNQRIIKRQTFTICAVKRDKNKCIELVAFGRTILINEHDHF